MVALLAKGTAQTWGILGSALGVYRLVPGNPRVKAMAALGSLGLSIPSVVYFHAVENPNGFNRLMYSWVRYKQTGNWPPSIPNLVQDEDLKDIIPNLVKESESKYDSLSANQQNPTSSIMPKDFNSNLDTFLDNFIPDNLFSIILDFFRPVAVTGYLDDLKGQQLFIHILLFYCSNIFNNIINYIFIYTNNS
jgi:hypothetical protein